MSQETKIQLDYSCHQPFWNFKKQDGEKYCKKCKHKTYDFSQSTPEEIFLILQQNNGKACGSFYKDQVEINEHTKHSPAAYRIALASIISFFAATELDAQSAVTDTSKTEQHVVAQSQDKTVVYELDEKGNKITTCPINDSPEPTTTYKRHKRRIRLGSYYLNLRFPFVHRMRSGFYRAAPRQLFPHKNKDKARAVF
ncbi:MAG: hypothetical protein M3R27_04660 [Bacteroidota bacterium]|nr:hypothetical protein [Bacteroidota bacterium]